MAKRSRSSRSERKAERERAEHAREHGLPAAARPAKVAARPGLGSAESDVPDLDAASPRALAGKRSSSPPALVWVVGGALAILVVVYVLSRLRAP